MKTATVRTLSLTVAFTVVIGVWLRHRVVIAAAAGGAVSAGEFVVPRLDAQDVATVQNVYKAESFDFRLKPGSRAVDRGKALPNVTDGFAGAAPDLGAIELGQTTPHYGPRD
jgi:hypothetical protein